MSGTKRSIAHEMMDLLDRNIDGLSDGDYLLLANASKRIYQLEKKIENGGTEPEEEEELDSDDEVSLSDSQRNTVVNIDTSCADGRDDEVQQLPDRIEEGNAASPEIVETQESDAQPIASFSLGTHTTDQHLFRRLSRTVDRMHLNTLRIVDHEPGNEWRLIVENAHHPNPNLRFTTEAIRDHRVTNSVSAGQATLFNMVRRPERFIDPASIVVVCKPHPDEMDIPSDVDIAWYVRTASDILVPLPVSAVRRILHVMSRDSFLVESALVLKFGYDFSGSRLAARAYVSSMDAKIGTQNFN